MEITRKYLNNDRIQQEREDEQTPLQLGKAQPPIFKTYPEAEKIRLTDAFEEVVKNNDFLCLLKERKSRRLYEEEPLTLDQLSFLLWASQGVKEVAGLAYPVSVRVVPSAGSRHALETYIYVNRVEGLEQGWYHYNAEEHSLEKIKTGRSDSLTDAGSNQPSLQQELADAFGGQSFFANCAAAFIWTAVLSRMEWRYGKSAYRHVLLDAGHACQSLYLAGEAAGCGICANTFFDQEKADALFGLRETIGTDAEEMVVYAASVGKIGS